MHKISNSQYSNPSLVKLVVEEKTSCKYLGMRLDPNLDFKSHIGVLSKLRFLFPKSILRLLYYALIHPPLFYALPVWGSTFFT